MKHLYELFELQEQQPFLHTSPRLDLNRVLPNLKKYKDAVYYLVDCRDSRILAVKGNVQKVLNRNPEELDHLSKIYELIHERHQKPVLNFHILSLKWALDKQTQLVPLVNSISIEANFLCRDKAKSFKWDTRFAHIDAKGNITHLVGILKPGNEPMVNGIKILRGPCSEYVCYPEPFRNQSVLGQKEMLILNELALGYSNRQIADRVHLSYRTVETHRKNMIHKLEARNTPHLIYLSTQMGLL